MAENDGFAAEQWRRYLGFCGKWHGSWNRFSAEKEGLLAPGASFEAVCLSKQDEDNVRCVKHLNYYEKEVVPVGGKVTGREVDGLQEVDFGSFTDENFQHPFGPASTAIYFDDCAAVAPTQVNPWPPKMFAAELLALSSEPRKRRRFVAVWKPEDQKPEGQTPEEKDALLGSPVLQLASVTAISDREGQCPESDDNCDTEAESADWPSQRIAINVADGKETCDEAIPDWESDGSWEALAGVADIEAWVPRQLTHAMLLSGKPAIGLTWRRHKGEALRVGVVYDKEGQMCQLVRELRCQPTDGNATK